MLALTQGRFDEASQNRPSCDWVRVNALRRSYLDREDLDETFAGTISYLIEAGILLKKRPDEVDLYTLSPAMVAPLMASRAPSSGESRGFKLLSMVRTAGPTVFKELAKEAAQIVFTSATIGIGKLVMGG